MKLLESSSSYAIKNFVMGDIQEHRDGLTSKIMWKELYDEQSILDKTVPVSTKTEEKRRTTKLVSRKVESDQGGLMSYGTCHTLPPDFLLPDPHRRVALKPRIPAI